MSESNMQNTHSPYTPTTEEGAEIMNDYIPTTGEIRLLMQSSNIAFEIPPEGFDRWLAEVIRNAKNDAWHEGFSAGWDECDDPSGFVNDKWDAKTPSPYRKEENND